MRNATTSPANQGRTSHAHMTPPLPPPSSRPKPSSLRLSSRNPVLLKTASARDPDNPYLDSTDSELDEIESDIELERIIRDEIQQRQKPHLRLPQDGYVCYYCGVLIPYQQWSPPYPQIYVCQECKCHLQEHSSSSITTSTSNRSPSLETHRRRLRHAVASAERIFNLRSSTYPRRHQRTTTRRDLKSDVSHHNVKSKVDRDDEELEDIDLLKSENIEPSLDSSLSSSPPLVAGGLTWTGEESDLFFHGLRRFGKHNVWAIKDHIQTKTLAEVVTMIQTMEVELKRQRRQLRSEGLLMSLKNMPMAEEVNEAEIEVEERLANQLQQEEDAKWWEDEPSQETADTRPEYVKKSQVFNMRTLADLSTRLYIQNHQAGITRDVVYEMYDALVAWLKPLIKELAMVNNEQNRVRDLLRQTNVIQTTYPEHITEVQVLRVLLVRDLPSDTHQFFDTLPQRLKYLPFDDSPEVMQEESRGITVPTPLWTFDGLGKKYYLNEQVDLARALAPDSDQDEETDDGAQAEEDMETTLEAPSPFIPSSTVTTVLKTRDQKLMTKYAEKYFEQREEEELKWHDFWSYKAKEAREYTKVMEEREEEEEEEGNDGEDSRWIATNRRNNTRSNRKNHPNIHHLHKRFRASQPHPTEPKPQPYNEWYEGVTRLIANSYSLPITPAGKDMSRPAMVQKDTDLLHVIAKTSMNKRAPSHGQALYIPNYFEIASLKVDDSNNDHNNNNNKNLKRETTRQHKKRRLGWPSMTTKPNRMEEIVNNANYCKDIAAIEYDPSISAPGYGQPFDSASFSLDLTRTAVDKGGFGLGKRKRAGLWTSDVKTGSDFEQEEDKDEDKDEDEDEEEVEEEEERRWKRQMQADMRIQMEDN
ncbi:hypothetical protein BG004_006918 [Podila humilis]|nr:hypothetical protein BG004_006918 [Podila humilis]